MKIKKWLKAAGIRAVKTIAQTNVMIAKNILFTYTHSILDLDAESLSNFCTFLYSFVPLLGIKALIILCTKGIL